LEVESLSGIVISKDPSEVINLLTLLLELSTVSKVLLTVLQKLSVELLTSGLVAFALIATIVANVVNHKATFFIIKIKKYFKSFFYIFLYFSFFSKKQEK